MGEGVTRPLHPERGAPAPSRRAVVAAALVVVIAGCATLEAQQKRLAADPLFGGKPTPATSPGAKATPTPVAKATPVGKVTPRAATPSERARAAVDAFSADDERALGEAIALRIVASTLAKKVPEGAGTRPSRGLELRDDALLAYVSNVGNLVALQGERQPKGGARGWGSGGEAPGNSAFSVGAKQRMKARRFTFAVLDTAEVGAYSTPGGFIFVTRGLLAKLTSESELAFVLGHEIAHVDWEDGLSALKADIATKTYVGAFAEAFPTLPGTGTATAAATPVDPAAEQARQQAAFNAIADRFYDLYEGTGLARESEQRADEKGLEYSTKAGYDGQGGARALEALAPPEGGPMFGRALGDSITRVVTHGSKRERLSEMGLHLQKAGRTGAARYDRNALARVEQLAVAP